MAPASSLCVADGASCSPPTGRIVDFEIRTTIAEAWWVHFPASVIEQIDESVPERRVATGVREAPSIDLQILTPSGGRGLALALVSSELVGIAEARRARVM